MTDFHVYTLSNSVRYEMKAFPLDEYPAKSRYAAGIMLMIMNNLDVRVAQYPHELITYGGNGSVFQNWAQYHWTMHFLSRMDDEQTLVMCSGHPSGSVPFDSKPELNHTISCRLFPSHKDAPRVVVTNGMVIPNYSTRRDYEILYAQGNTQFGQMTAGSYCCKLLLHVPTTFRTFTDIGPQGIVHGTTITLMNAARHYLGASTADQMHGLVSSRYSPAVSVTLGSCITHRCSLLLAWVA
jgi:urocanate hydratase